jgi:small subunit ribosomal protein S1
MSDDLQQMLSGTELHTGDVVEGTVVAVDEKKVTVDIGASSGAIIPIRELSPLHIQHPSEIVQIGDTLRAVVVKLDEETGTFVLSKRQADAKNAWEILRQRHENQEAFDVTVYDVVKGGLVADVGVRGFVPASLVDTQFVKDLNEFKGKTIQVVVHEIDEENNKLILSRRGVLEEEQKGQLRNALNDIHEGDILTGTVRRLANFGAFVEVLPGIDGLVHVSELAWHRVNTPSDAVQVGDEVRVRVLRIDPDAGKVSLSIKQAEKSPFDQAMGQLREGDILEGTVTRVVDFGAFVEVAQGVEGLVHVSQIAHHHVAKASDELEPGQTVTVRILGIDPDRGRVSLSIREAVERPQSPSPGRGGGKQPRRSQESSADYGDKGTGATFGDIFGELFRR